jgi:murein DD-endopeptidase MepM/ murein hydrolase activator NlpD
MNNKKTLVSILAGIMAAVMILSLLASIIPAVSAASSAEIRNELNDLKADREKIKDEIGKLEDQIDDNMTEIQKIIKKKNLIEDELALLYQQVENINKQIAAYGLLIADKQDELDEAKARHEELSAKNKERIRAMEENGKLSYWSVLFEANSFSDLLDRLQMVEEIASADQRRLKAMREAAQAVEEAQTALNAEKAELETTRAELDAVEADLVIKRQEADAILIELNAKDDELEDLLEQQHDADEKLQKEIAKAEKEYNEAKRKEEEEKKKQEQQQQQQQQQQKPDSTVTAGIKWTRPCYYRYLSSPYGYRVHPVYGTWKFHSGVDLAGPEGTPIVATRDGTVTMAKTGYNGGNGNYVTINHGDGFSSSYLHMLENLQVSAGQKVKAGQVIGYMGSTGISTGPHLHFTIYYNGSTVNPADYINF